MQIKTATLEHLGEVSCLFDKYRQFYECEPDISAAKKFISDRMSNDESTIFVALDDNESAVGFVQLYPSFCSVDAIKIQILYDLYVDQSQRKNGVGEALMNRASQFAKESGASRVDLLTATTNKAGQALYEKLGYKDSLKDFIGYSLTL